MSTPATTETPLMERLQAKSAERAKITEQIARMLWESGPMTADWEGGGAPDWDDIAAARAPLPEDADEGERERHEAYADYWLDTWHKAEALHALDAQQSMVLARIMLEQAERLRKAEVADLWRKVERAAGYEPGSLTGKPGVKQRVFL